MVQSSYGVAGISPILVENQMLYVQRARFNVYEMAFSIYSSVLSSSDLNVFATLDSTTGAKELKYQQVPYRTIWLITQDGQLWGLTYKKDDQIAGWHLHNSLAGNVSSVAVIPAPDGSRDILYLALERGDGYFSIETEDPALMTDSASQSVFSNPVGAVGALQYLAGYDADIKVDGTYRGRQAVSSTGTVTINPPGLNVEVGFPYTGTILTNRLAERGGANIQGLLKHWNMLWIRVNTTIGAKINGTRQPTRQPSTNMDGPVAPFTGDLEAKAGPGNNREGQILIESDQPFYCEILAIFGQVSVGEI
jgi:hypothetical protein